MSDLGKLYQQVILEHHAAPQHAVRLAESTHDASAHNPLCGDRVHVGLAISAGRVVDAACEVQGCAICRASGSLMTLAIIGHDVGAVRDLVSRFLAAIRRDPPAPGAAPASGVASAPGVAPASRVAPAPPASSTGETPGAPVAPLAAPLEDSSLAPLLEARRFPSRRRCASLCWEALGRALPAA